jgi:xanthine dehydrogenase YagS FAD-binding subunit
VRPFAYEKPSSRSDAVALAAGDDGAAFVAGGTNLVDLMRLGVIAPQLLVDVSAVVPRAIEETPPGGLLIGAGSTNADVAADLRVRQRYPLLARALLSGASPQLRNAATTGGNLLQRTRCLYFQDVTKPCNKRSPGSGCPAHEGEHRTHAILGWSESCCATHPSDMAVALVALDAVVHVQGSGGTRTIAVEGLHRLPEQRPERDTVLEQGELITAVELPPPPAGASTYRKVRERAAFAFALVSVAAAVDVVDGRVRSVRIALGGVAHKPWRARIAEEALLGRAAAELSYVEAADAELAQARPLRGTGYKVLLARNAIVDTLLAIGGQT